MTPQVQSGSRSSRVDLPALQVRLRGREGQHAPEEPDHVPREAPQGEKDAVEKAVGIRHRNRPRARPAVTRGVLPRALAAEGAAEPRVPAVVGTSEGLEA